MKQTRSYLGRRINRGSMTDSNWTSVEEVDVSVETVVTIMKRKRKLPAPLVEAHKHALDTSSRELTRRFYEKLTTRCPEALDYFMD
ncbi:MAG: hypothetical protein WCI87_01195 [Euryarchaeota archaeon]